jgi:hypothetical protein
MTKQFSATKRQHSFLWYTAASRSSLSILTKQTAANRSSLSILTKQTAAQQAARRCPSSFALLSAAEASSLLPAIYRFLK